MARGPHNFTITLIGGDQRQYEVARALREVGFSIRTYGLPYEGFQAQNWREALSNSHGLVLPISGVSPQKTVRTLSGDLEIDQEFWHNLSLECLVVTGSWPESFELASNEKKLKIIEYAEIDEIAVPNAILTAEGAVKIAISETPYSLNDQNILIIGFGRVGVATAKVFSALNTNIYIAARRQEVRNIAALSGYHSINFDQISEQIGKMAVIINTVPAKVLTGDLIQHISDKEVLIIDLASAPGGVDFEATEKLGIKAILALGLPGKVAPKTAGKILASTLPSIIRRELGLL